jgi:hypothetical protein
MSCESDRPFPGYACVSIKGVKDVEVRVVWSGVSLLITGV